ncbi:serine/threonine-protein kinase [Prevotellamassilia timonensis]|uniref:serine/threonine-protein kinase n=1 Tax=Prevotellamassilia timonensis TaxID=1852370 RepID=UPI00307A6698
MTELSKNSIVSLVGGGTATIIKELGRGGQGIVYLVEVCGEKKALKWYLNAPDDKFYRNLDQNIASGAPSDAFLWPEYLTEKQQGSYGYIMKLRPQNYYEFGNFLLAKVSFKSFTAMLSAAMKICDGFMMLHRFGYSYQDLNDGNFFIDPQTGDVLICDNDNVMPQGEKSGIMGKARYMAPEIVAGGIPDKYSDRFSLSVILFMLFYANHPFEGAKVVACPCMTEAFEKKFYGSEALFIYDPTDKSNLPVRGIHQNVIRRWPVFPQMLRDAFIEEFSKEKLQDPSTRMIEQNWKKIISSVRDSLVVCQHCAEETFVNVSDSTDKCMNCGKDVDLSKRLVINNRSLPLTQNTYIYIDEDNTPDGVVTTDSNGFMLIKNISTETWTVETPSGKIKTVAPNEILPVKEGLKITFRVHTMPYKAEIKFMSNN